MFKKGDKLRTAWWSEVSDNIVGKAHDEGWCTRGGKLLLKPNESYYYGNLPYGSEVVFQEECNYRWRTKTLIVTSYVEEGQVEWYVRPQMVTNKPIAKPGDILRSRKLYIHLATYNPATKRGYPWRWRYCTGRFRDNNRPEFYTVIAVDKGFYGFSDGTWGSIGDFYIPSQFRKE